MHQALSNLLSKPEQLITAAIGELEARAGFPSEDVRLVAENKQKIRQKISELGLDPDDTTHEELYHALLSKFGSDAKLFDQAITTDGSLSLAQKVNLAGQVCRQLFTGQQVWSLKPTVAKRLLVAHPPKKVMKLLNYRSINSMTKRESVNYLYLLSEALETQTWNRVLERQVTALPSNNWLMRPIQFEQLLAKSLNIINEPDRLVTASKQCGAVAIWTSQQLSQVSILNLVLLLIEATQQLGLTTHPRQIANLHPALNWWSNAMHLISDHSGRVMSFNIKDVARSYLFGSGFEDRILDHGRASFWQELLSRYQNYAYATQEVVAQDYTDPVKNDQSNNASLPKDVALEYSEV